MNFEVIIGKVLSLLEASKSKLTKIIFARKANNCRSINDIVELAFGIFCNFSFRKFESPIRPIQVKEEIVEFLKILIKLKTKFILEIGTANGGTLFLFSRIVVPNAMIISIDLPGGRFGGGYPQSRLPLYRSFGSPNQTISLIREDSHALSTHNAIISLLKGRKLDLLFIDGDHTYDGVKKDFEMYRSLVRKGGIIAFHDIVPGSPEDVGGVPRFWSEIRHSYRYLEIVNDWTQKGCGIGIVYV